MHIGQSAPRADLRPRRAAVRAVRLQPRRRAAAELRHIERQPCREVQHRPAHRRGHAELAAGEVGGEREGRLRTQLVG